MNQEALFATALAASLLSKFSHTIVLLAKTPGFIYESTMADSVVVINKLTA